MKLLASLGLGLLAASLAVGARAHVFVALQPPAAHPATAPDGAAGAQQVPVALDATRRLSVPVRIDGEQLHFLIDTASTRSVIASDVATRLALGAGSKLEIVHIGGVDQVPSVIIPALSFSDVALSDVEAPALLRGNLGSDGLLGLDVLRNDRLSIDFTHQARLTVTPSPRRPERERLTGDSDLIIVTARSRLGELVVTDAEIDGTALAVILDTGAEESIGNPALARLLARRGVENGGLHPTVLTSVTGAVLKANYTSIASMRIGGVIIHNVPMAFGDLETFRHFGLVKRPALLLGMSTLSVFSRVTIDFPRREIHFVMSRHATVADGG